MNLPMDRLVVEGNMGEDKTSPTMLSFEKHYEKIIIKQENLYRLLNQYNYIRDKQVSIESFIFKDLVDKTIGRTEISNEGARDLLGKVWNHLKEALSSLREEIENFFIKINTNIGNILSEWNKIKKEFDKDRKSGKLVEVSSPEINKDWYYKALDKGKLTYINFDQNGNIEIGKENRFKPLSVDMEGFITKTFKLINVAYRENNYLNISQPLSNLFSETFILFDRIKHRTTDILMREVYEIAHFGSNSLYVPVIPIYDKTSAEYIQEFRPIQFAQPSQFNTNTINGPICTFDQIDQVNQMLKDLKQVVDISSRNYKRIAGLLSKEEKKFTDMIVSVSDSRVSTVDQLQKVIAFLNRISTLELEYCRILLRSGHDLVYFAKCALLVMKNYGAQFNS